MIRVHVCTVCRRAAMLWWQKGGEGAKGQRLIVATGGHLILEGMHC
jgi:hypothetical protein